MCGIAMVKLEDLDDEIIRLLNDIVAISEIDRVESHGILETMKLGDRKLKP